MNMPSTAYAEFHRRSIEDRDAFWREQAASIDWQTPFTQVCDYANPPFARWFVGGTTNLCHNAVDRHVATRGDQNALIFVSTETNQERIYSFRDLQAEVQHTGEMFTDDLNTVAPTANGQRGLIDSATILNLAVNVTPGGGNATFFATVKNVTDELYIVDRARGILPGAPRLLQAGVSLRF